MQNKRLIDESSIFFVENIMMDDLDDGITSFVQLNVAQLMYCKKVSSRNEKAGVQSKGKREMLIEVYM